MPVQFHPDFIAKLQGKRGGLGGDSRRENARVHIQPDAKHEHETFRTVQCLGKQS